MNNFSKYKAEFDKNNQGKTDIECFLPVNTSIGKRSKIQGSAGKPNEEYYKWQFLYAIVQSGMYAKDFIGTEVFFPKGNKSSAPIKFDGAIFDSADWFDHYKAYWENKSQEELDWLRKHLLGVIEFKKEDAKDVEKVYNQQLKAAMRESEREFCLGVLYDTERLFLFKKQGNKYLRLSEDYNQKGEGSGTKDLSLHLPDPYLNIPSFEKILDWEGQKENDRSKRGVTDLEEITGVQSTQINNAMSEILRTMDKVGLVNQRGYEALISVLALKIFDEKRNEKNPSRKLDFYISQDERHYNTINEKPIQAFLKRIQALVSDAEGTYYTILERKALDFTSENQVKVMVEVVTQLQDYTLVRSHKTDLYQLVFHRFATAFKKAENAQFVTPLPLIDFLVQVVNPRNGETVIDPTVGIADFLSVSYVNSESKLDDNNIYGVDIDDQMVMLATLNMLLNGDGNARIVAKNDYGSIETKFDNKGQLIDLIPDQNKNGQWDNRADGKKLKKFDVVLTNPPFGEDRAYRPKTPKDFEVIECYELWNIARAGDWIDLGIVFLENAYRILAENGRIGIVLSNSIASIDRWQKAREWLMEKMRIVAIFDLPAGVFAETGVNTTVIVAYKPEPEELEKLKEKGYKVYIKDIQRVGYEVRTSKRVQKFENQYKINYETFDIEIDDEGRPILDEEFSGTVADFREWCKLQEKTLQDLFIKIK
jgi:type I restriction enzyme M protein